MTARVPIDDPTAQEIVGREWSFSRTVGEYDVLSFGGVTGDLAANHIDERYMQEHGFAGRIAHGVLLLGYTSTLSTRVAELFSGAVVSLGYDRVRFTAPVSIGDTITCRYRVLDVDPEARRIHSEATITIAPDGDTALVATHIMKAV